MVMNIPLHSQNISGRNFRQTLIGSVLDIIIRVHIAVRNIF